MKYQEMDECTGELYTVEEYDCQRCDEPTDWRWLWHLKGSAICPSCVTQEDINAGATKGHRQ